ncbi:SDR family NAD(P)-dependent oxidoreductase [Aquiflexum lacus]|uniref:SDR family NAD(P)-dependent oxidoreductase n=1 Tax=Aquiflexum lacus TaxID=2483805 RepID=UPI0018939227|nr:SDR family NAD(P)-dependent oxidoreductase [Aquiflexum lacus]
MLQIKIIKWVCKAIVVMGLAMNFGWVNAQDPVKPKTVLVTGAANGIGKATAIAFAQKGYITYATDKNISKMQDLTDLGCRVRYIDVTIDSIMVSEIRAIEAETGGIDILVNNAGYGQNGFLEELSIEKIQQQFDVNVFGLIRMTQLVLPLMRERKSGRIINIGSVGGEFTTPGATAYHASKWALESITDGFRGELRPFGIEVVLIKPGGVYTNFMSTANQLYPEPMPESPYMEMREKFLAQSNAMFDLENRTYGILTPEKVAEVIVKSAEKRKPKTRYRIGALAKITPRIRGLKSDRGFDKFMLRQFNVSTEKGESVF